MELSLKDKIAVVTGGRQGIGHCITETFLAAGASVVTCARDEAGLKVEVEKWRARYGERIVGIRADVGQPQDVERLLAEVSQRFGGIDVLVNNAATTESGTLASLSDAQWHKEFDVKLMAMIRSARAAVPLMLKRGGGSIININAIFARQPDVSFYASSVVRAGCLAFTKLLAKEYSGKGIRANAIGLGLVETPAWRTWHDPRKGSYEAFLKSTAEHYHVPIGRIAQPQEVGNVALFLASDAASYVTGTQLDVDGGMAAYL
ncbi:SDR family NAD(P)-dependent oxidoreductase [Immundisolibacter sp.]|uniref:SDR family NAD(P)-dependent oxidoreductase n=1 Tax=Immundisolibacter sp. TaxID=1934948 RepID=UPI003568BEF4